MAYTTFNMITICILVFVTVMSSFVGGFLDIEELQSNNYEIDISNVPVALSEVCLSFYIINIINKWLSLRVRLRRVRESHWVTQVTSLTDSLDSVSLTSLTVWLWLTVSQSLWVTLWLLWLWPVLHTTQPTAYTATYLLQYRVVYTYSHIHYIL